MQDYEDMRHRAEAAEADRDLRLQYLDGSHQDNADLQRQVIEREMAIRALQGGMVEQAAETAKMRQACDL